MDDPWDELRLAGVLPDWWVRLAPGEQLREVRAYTGVSQRQLADLSGVPQPVISRLEKGGQARLSTWIVLFGSFGFDFAPVPSKAQEDMEDMHEHERRRRSDKQLMSRKTWGSR